MIADAATSVLAIVALAGGWLFGWSWLDPVMGIVGAVARRRLGQGPDRRTGKVLLDREMDHPVVDEIREVVAERGAGQRDRDRGPARLARRQGDLLLCTEPGHPR